jgi:hypothetical protein
VAKSARFVAVHRELFVVQHGFAEQLDLLDLIVRQGGEPIDRLRLDAIDLGFDLRDLCEYLRCQCRAGGLHIDSASASGDEKRDRRATEGGQNGRPAYVEPISASEPPR